MRVITKEVANNFVCYILARKICGPAFLQLNKIEMKYRMGINRHIEIHKCAVCKLIYGEIEALKSVVFEDQYKTHEFHGQTENKNPIRELRALFPHFEMWSLYF